MTKRLLICATIVLFFVTGCIHKRVFQTSVPDNVEKPKPQVQGEKRAASLIKLKSSPPVANPEKAVSEIHELATELSSSLGEPEKPVTLEDQSKVIAELRGGLLAKEKQLD